MNNDTFVLSVEDICEICHNSIGEIKRLNGEPPQADWDNAEDWQKKSTLDQVLFHIKNPGASPDRFAQRMDGQQD